jgi:dienelactone hydrolase
MYRWLAQDLAERGYVVLTYDVQGQGGGESLPHEPVPGGTSNALPFCNPFAAPRDGEQLGCPGVPFQQLSNFVVGTRDALSFFTSTAARHYANPRSEGARVSAFNPYWRLFDRSPDRRTATPGRTSRIAIIGHSMGAAAVSKLQGTDRRVAAVVALDKLAGPGSTGALDGTGNKPVVPALALQSEYGFTVSPYLTSGGSSLTPGASPDGPDPRRERATGYDAWRKAGVDSMLVVPRASTHLDYTDIPLILPASRYGQDLASHYTQAWLDRYLKHRRNDAALTGRSFRYLEPTGHGVWKPTTLDRDSLLSFYYCSAYGFRSGTKVLRNGDIGRVGC